MTPSLFALVIAGLTRDWHEAAREAWREPSRLNVTRATRQWRRRNEWLAMWGAL